MSTDDAGEVVRLRAVMRGRVQMVGFRMFTESAVAELNRAASRPITGVVKNLPDGSSVEVIAEGARADLEALLAELEIGPPMAMVRSVNAEWSEPTLEYAEFETAY